MLTLHQMTLKAADVEEIDGIRVTTVRRTVADLLLSLERYDAVAVLDSALHQGLLSPEDLATLEESLYRRRGALAARRYLLEANGSAESPLETCVRLQCVDGGVPPSDLQYPVRDRQGRLLGYGDLAWRAFRLIGEADGVAFHSHSPALLRDRRRQNDFVNAGFAVVRFTWQDTLRPGYIPSTVRQFLRRAC